MWCALSFLSSLPPSVKQIFHLEPAVEPSAVLSPGASYSDELCGFILCRVFKTTTSVTLLFKTLKANMPFCLCYLFISYLVQIPIVWSFSCTTHTQNMVPQMRVTYKEKNILTHFWLKNVDWWWLFLLQSQSDLGQEIGSVCDLSLIK